MKQIKLNKNLITARIHFTGAILDLQYWHETTVNMTRSEPHTATTAETYRQQFMSGNEIKTNKALTVITTSPTSLPMFDTELLLL